MWPFRKKKKERIEHRFVLGGKSINCLIRGGQLTFVNEEVMVHLVLINIGHTQMMELANTARIHGTGTMVSESVVVEE